MAMLEVENKGGRKVNRARKDGARGRRIKKVLGNTEWFRVKRKKDTVPTKTSGTNQIPMPREVSEVKWEARDTGNGGGRSASNRETEAAVFVPCTRGSKLQKMIQLSKTNGNDIFASLIRIK